MWMANWSVTVWLVTIAVEFYKSQSTSVKRHHDAPTMRRRNGQLPSYYE